MQGEIEVNCQNLGCLTVGQNGRVIVVNLSHERSGGERSSLTHDDGGTLARGEVVMKLQSDIYSRSRGRCAD